MANVLTTIFDTVCVAKPAVLKCNQTRVLNTERSIVVGEHEQISNVLEDINIRKHMKYIIVRT